MALAACAVLAGATSLAAIAEWAADVPPELLVRPGGPCREPDTGPVAPAEATVRRVLHGIDGDALDAAIGAWLADRARDDTAGQPDPPAPALAVDGKTVRGARRPDGTQVHLLSAMSQEGLVLAQREVDAKSNEITAFRPLLAALELTGQVVTSDAIHSQTGHARFLVGDKHAHYIALIKGNHPTLHQQLKQLPWKDVPLLGKTRATAHGRVEIRRIKVATVVGLPFPHAGQALQIVRRRRTVTTGKTTLERVYAVTSMAAHQADAAEIAHRVRGHRGMSATARATSATSSPPSRRHCSPTSTARSSSPALPVRHRDDRCRAPGRRRVPYRPRHALGRAPSGPVHRTGPLHPPRTVRTGALRGHRGDRLPRARVRVITFFNCMHDVAHPDKCARHCLDALKPDGYVLMVEPIGGDRVEDNFTPAGRLMSGSPVLCCTPHGMVDDGEALGTVVADKRLEEIMREAGFRTFRRVMSNRFSRVFEARP